MKMVRRKVLKGLLLGAEGVPHLQEHDGKIPSPFAYQPNACVFPMAVRMGSVDLIV